jgi:hypothetical protein
MKRLLMLMLVLLAACGGAPNPGPGGTAGQIKAATGGVLEAGGAKLTIPPGALSQDATVTLVSKGKASEPVENPLQPAGTTVALDLGGAELKSPANLELPVDATGEGSLVVLETLPEDDTSADAPLWVHAARPVGATQAGLSTQGLSALSLFSRVTYSVRRAALYAVQVIRKSPTSDGTVGASLQVPFYWQAVYPWCTPTSLSMALNYYKPDAAISGNSKFPGGFVSNYGLASLIKQPANSGSGGFSIVKAIGSPKSSYSLLRWDAELVPSDKTEEQFDGAFDAFKSYVSTITAGNAFGGNTPVWTASDRQSHAFVLTGVTNANNDGVFVNNANDRWGGTHPSLTWKEFREANCTLKDPNDPSKGCADKGSGQPDLFTFVSYAKPKPETERRGSIELLPGGESDFKGGIAETVNSTIIFRDPSNNVVSRWMWDGRFANGYYFSDAAKLDPKFRGGANLPSDSEFLRSIYRSSKLETVFNIVNTTNLTLDYELEARLFVGGTSRAQKTINPKIKAASFQRMDLDWGNLADVAGAVGAPTTARLEFNLRQGGVLQDVKHVSFRLVPDPTDKPSARIITPFNGTTLLKGAPFTFKGEAFDPHALPDGRLVGNKLTWFENGAKVAEGPQYTATYTTPGTRTLSFVARNDYGVQATATVSVSVIDPTRTPGEIVIVSPQNNAQFNHEQFEPAVVPLVGYATYSDGSAVPNDRLVWTRDGVATEIGRGSSLTVDLTSGVFDATYTLRLNVLSADGQNIGSKAVSVKVVCNACVN